MSSLEISLYQGWNLVAYPVQVTQTVSQALASIEGSYGTVYHYDPANKGWQVYSPDVPDWVSDLPELRFGQGYWINATQAITLYLKSTSATSGRSASNLPVSPATYYGAITVGPDFTPVPGLEVVAYVDGRQCGATKTELQALHGQPQLVYAIKVWADDPGEAPGCGGPGKTVSFTVLGIAMAESTGWQNDRVQELSLTPSSTASPLRQIYLPVVSK